MRCLLIKLEAPLMAFGGVTVDAIRPTDRAPGASLLTGMLGNALGFRHRDHDQLQHLQSRLVFGVLCSRPGERLMDYQTTDLGQPHLVDTGWTTWGRRERRGGAFSKGTHIRHREYLADAEYRVALHLDPADESPTVEDLASALDLPERPLFIGRKACVPSSRLSLGVVDADSLRSALLDNAGVVDATVQLWLPAPADSPPLDGTVSWVSDQRDWQNQVHVGRRLVRHEQVQLGGHDG